MEGIRFEYSPFLGEYSLIVDGRTILCCDNLLVEALMREGCYDTHMECFKHYCADIILELIEKNDCFAVRNMLKWIFSHKFEQTS